MQRSFLRVPDRQCRSRNREAESDTAMPAPPIFVSHSSPPSASLVCENFSLLSAIIAQSHHSGNCVFFDAITPVSCPLSFSALVLSPQADIPVSKQSGCREVILPAAALYILPISLQTNPSIWKRSFCAFDSFCHHWRNPIRKAALFAAYSGFGNLNRHLDKLVSPASAVQALNALALEFEDIAGLGPFVHMIAHLAVQRGNHHICAKAACVKVMGISHQTSLPLRSNMGWGLTET